MRIDPLEQIRRESGDRVHWRVVRSSPSSPLGESVELELWSDDRSALSISRVKAKAKSVIRLRHSEQLAADIHPKHLLIVHAADSVSSDTVDHFLADQVIPRAMAGDGQYLLHAAAVRHGCQSILLIGASGHGKSTLSASFQVAGHTLLGDDATVISWRDVLPVARPVYRSLRLLPDSLRALLPGDVVTSRVADYTTKRNVVVDDPEGEPGLELPVAAIFLLGDPLFEGRPKVRDLTLSAACMALVENAFSLNPADTAQAHHRLSQSSRLVASVPTFEISYPRNYALLPEVRAAILDRVGYRGDENRPSTPVEKKPQ